MFTPQPIAASGQQGKEQAVPTAEHLFTWYGVGLSHYNGASHEQACSVGAELPKVTQGKTAVPEAPGAYGILGSSYTTRPDAYATASALALASDLNPKIGMALRYASRGYHADLKSRGYHTDLSSMSVQPLNRHCISKGKRSLRASVQACRCHNRHVQDRLWRRLPRFLDRTSTELAYQLP